MHTHNPARARTLAPGSVENIVSGSTHLFFFFWLCWVFAAVCRLSLVAVSRGYSPAAVLRLLTVVASLVEGALECWPSSCGTQALVARGM